MTAPRWGSLALAGVLALMVAARLLGGGGPPDDPRRVAVQTSLLDPYAEALAEGRYAEAWATWTSAGYRRHTSEVVFLTGQVRAAEELGPVRALKASADAPEQHDEPGLGPFLRVSVVRDGDLDVTVLFDVVQEGGAWRIARTWAVPPQGFATERVF